jgi:hypothetical protein
MALLPVTEIVVVADIASQVPTQSPLFVSGECWM